MDEIEFVRVEMPRNLVKRWATLLETPHDEKFGALERTTQVYCARFFINESDERLKDG